MGLDDNQNNYHLILVSKGKKKKPKICFNLWKKKLIVILNIVTLLIPLYYLDSLGYRWQENDSHYTKRDVLTHLSRSPGVNTGTKIFTCWIQVIVSSFLSPFLVLLPISVGLVFILLPCNWQMKTSTLMCISVFLTICGSSIRGCIFSKVSAQMSKKNCDWPI